MMLNLTKRQLYSLASLVSAVGLVGIISPTISFSSPPRSQCSASLGKLNITYVIQHPGKENWCWVATVSEILKWFGLPNSDQCQLYDLVHRTNSCRASTGYDGAGAPEWVVEKYEEKIGGIKHVRHYRPKHLPLTFEQIQDRICPKNSAGVFDPLLEGEPFVWAYDNGAAGDPDANYHDVVVYGYHLTTDENGVERKELYVHDPASPSVLEPNIFEYAWYADKGIWIEDILVSKSSGVPIDGR